MTILGSIPLKLCKFYSPWTDAPNGTLLQMREREGSGGLVVGMKSNLPRSGRPETPCLLFLDASGEA